MEYAITDIETTGGHASGNGITEICICIHDGTRVLERFHSLVKPDMAIPAYISGLTGINDKLVAEAPRFGEIAPTVYNLLNGRVFTAHSVNFDYSFIKKELSECGFDLQTKKLCTLRLSRYLFPGLSSYGLANICGYHGIEIPDRHRAHGDADATVKLFELMAAADKGGIIESFLKKTSKETTLPPNLDKKEFEALPANPGVYYFLDRKGKIVYVGKAKNLKKRVSSHFTNNSTSAQKQNFIREIFHIRFTVCADEAEALALETKEIQKLWPKFNRAQKRYVPLFGIVHYFDQPGFKRLGIQKLKSRRESQIHVSSLIEGYELLRTIATEHELCLRLAGIPKSREHCESEKCVCCSKSTKKMKAYNLRVENVLSQLVGDAVPGTARLC